VSKPFYAEGVYRCEVIQQGLTTASTGTMQIALKVKVLEDNQGPMPQQYERSVFLPVTERTMEYLVRKLEALGYTRDSFRYLDLQEANYHDLRGTVAEFYCKHESDQSGELREKWDVATGGGSKALELKPPQASELRRLDALFGRAKKATVGNGGPKPNGNASRPATPQQPPDFPNPLEISDDDVPLY
jgi:hypothetical protein